MRLFLASSLMALAATLAGSTPARPTSGQEPSVEGETRLRLARFEVEPETPTRARVRASFEIVGPGEVKLVMVWFEGQGETFSMTPRFDGVRFVETSADRPGRVRELLRLSPTDAPTRSGYLEYRLEVPEGRSFRFPLPVPDVAPEPGATIAVEVLLPPGAAYAGDGFPALAPAGERSGRARLRSRLSGVPSFVHVVWGERADPVTTPGVIQAVALVLVLVPVIWLAWRTRRSEAGAAPGVRS